MSFRPAKFWSTCSSTSRPRGLIDVAYTTPYHVRPDYAGSWGTDEFVFLSRYDGLTYIRINALDAFCLGLTERYQPTLEARPPLLAMGSGPGLTLLREPEPGERLLLERIAKSLSADLWALDPEALLRHSADPAEYQRIRAFLESAGDQTLPAACPVLKGAGLQLGPWAT